MTEVRMVNLDRRFVEMRGPTEQAVRRVLKSGVYVGGDEVTQFESAFALDCAYEHCVTVGSGLAALTLSLRALGIRPGDRVLVPSYTFIATWLAVLEVGADPVPCDVDARTGLLELSTYADLGTTPDAVVPVALYGSQVDLSAIYDRFGEAIPVVVDAAQYHGGSMSLPSAAVGPVAWAFSFYPTKNLGGLGDGGCVVTNDSALAAGIRSLRSYGAGADPYRYERLGTNSRMDPLQAAFLGQALMRLSTWNHLRRQHAQRYLEALGPARQQLVAGSNSVWHHFAISVMDRSAFRGFLSSRGIESGTHYPYVASAEISRLKGIPEGRGARSTVHANSQRLAQSIVTVPVDPWLRADEVDRVASALADASTDPTSGLLGAVQC